MARKKFYQANYALVNRTPVWCYSGEGKMWFLREEIGEALGFDNPEEAIEKIHRSNESLFKKHSTIATAVDVGPGSHEATMYDEIGVFKLCMLSEKENAMNVLEACRKMSRCIGGTLPPEDMTDGEFRNVLSVLIDRHKEDIIYVIENLLSRVKDRMSENNDA